MCNNCNNRSSNWGGVIDLNVEYTGCGGTCYGTPIKPGMTLREVLDIIVGNCNSIKDGSKWYWGEGVPTFPANDGDFYLQTTGEVWEYDETEGWQDTGISLGGLSSVNWGDIEGNISDQLDLVQFINSSIESYITNIAGTGLSYNTTTKKIDLGRPFLGEGFVQVPFTADTQVVAIGVEGTDGNVDQNGASITLIKGEGVMLSNNAGGIFRGVSVTSTSCRVEFGSNAISVSNSGVSINTTSMSMPGYSYNSGNAAITGGQVSLTGSTSILMLIGTDVKIAIDNSYIRPKRDVYFDSGGSVILPSPDGVKHKLQVDNAGVLSTIVVP